MVLREVAGWDAGRYDEVAAWELREVLLAYEWMQRAHALVNFRHEQLLYVLGGSSEKKAPTLPLILRDDD